MRRRDIHPACDVGRSNLTLLSEPVQQHVEAGDPSSTCEIVICILASPDLIEAETKLICGQGQIGRIRQGQGAASNASIQLAQYAPEQGTE